MSSHHIVREKQEPALFIVNLHHFSKEHLGQLLEWSPTVIVAEQVYEQAERIGIKIDGVVGATIKYRHLHHTHFIDSSGSPIQDGLKYLVGEKYPAVNIITESFMLKDYVLFAEHINLVIFVDHRKIFTIRSGFSKWQSKGQKIELLHEIPKLSTSGLIKISNHFYETQKDGFYSIAFDQPFAFIAENY
jgi:thiamine pyrophosphokinase